ncbi:hypothetical protein [Uliginosibacterium gangwonense]|uniref:hypothetical protein n=1 Tax=Uliginosibacterium gangwonense TaxID=392736 RepID=UPI0003623A19|nr:hypothetical protein [Uliginosibacterium gangwonense]
MPRAYNISRCLCLALALSPHVALAATPEVWPTRIDCGGIRFELTSYCTPSHAEDSLNECTRQTLSIPARQQNIALPNPDKKGARTFKAAHAHGVALFVTSAQCALLEGKPYLELNYSTGGGHNAYDEFVEFYDASLKPIHDEGNSALINAIIKSADRSKSIEVKSIMPSP